MSLVFGMIAHEAETGGDPTGFGLSSFITLMVGIVVIAHSLGRYLRAIKSRRTGTD